jgi:hypothetical protein
VSRGQGVGNSAPKKTLKKLKKPLDKIARRCYNISVKRRETRGANDTENFSKKLRKNLLTNNSKGAIIKAQLRKCSQSRKD